MSEYARGHKAVGICARSGKKTLLKNLIPDGRYPNLLVLPEWWEPKYPLEDPLNDIADGIALRWPSPERGGVPVTVRFPLFDVATGQHGSDLFELLPCDGFDFADLFKVAFYSERPGDAYSVAGEATGAGYVAGGVVLALRVVDRELMIGPTVIPTASVGAQWLLIYDVVTGRGLMRINLGSLHASQSGQFVIDWSNITVTLTEQGGCVRSVMSPS